MYVYIKSERYLWTVGFYNPQGIFQPDSDHETPEKAAARVHYLNGGEWKEPETNVDKSAENKCPLCRTEQIYYWV